MLARGPAGRANAVGSADQGWEPLPYLAPVLEVERRRLGVDPGHYALGQKSNGGVPHRSRRTSNCVCRR